MDYRLMYTGYPSVLKVYTDASWISNTKDDSSTSGCVFLLSSGAISWASKMQTCITGSTIESEFVALATTGKEAEWLKNLLLEISLWSKHIAPISTHCDSVATLAKAYSQMYNGRQNLNIYIACSKHILRMIRKYMCFSPLNVQLSTLNSAAKFPQQGVGCPSIQ
nr:zinc finger, CCHC-type [Tanacetum cinerariifolium]